MSKTALLENAAVEVVKSKLPATTPKREYCDFDTFVANADKLVAFICRVSKDEENLSEIEFEWVEWDEEHRSLDLKEARQQIEQANRKVQIAGYTLREFPQAHKLMAACKRDEKWYDRKELYEITGKGKRQKQTLSRRVVSEQIALLLASFQNARPGTPKVFGRMLTEEVYAANPNACVLESACRSVRRNQDFAPSIAELLKAINKESSAWCHRWEVLDETNAPLDESRQDFEKYIAEVGARIAAAEAKLAEREAKERAREERWRLYREAYDRIPEDERRAFERGQHSRGRPQHMQDSMPKGEREAAAYRAGFAGKEIPGLELKTNGHLRR
jgi:hypothetical protein